MGVSLKKINFLTVWSLMAPRLLKCQFLLLLILPLLVLLPMPKTHFKILCPLVRRVIGGFYAMSKTNVKLGFKDQK